MPGVALAQSAAGSIAGVARDTSGAVLPGVTVEAASPALIEKVRLVVTDGQGNYKITELRPGTYSVTFTLAGFSTVKREGIELTTGFTAPVNAELKVGSLEETVTITGASPIVDTQNVLTQTVLKREVLDQTPTAQNLTGFAALTVGVQPAGLSAGAPDVGGSIGEGLVTLVTHGGRQNDTHMTFDGLVAGNFTTGGGGLGRHLYLNRAYAEEVTLQTAALSAENETGGIEVNAVPKDGGNVFRGVFNADWANASLQTSNLDDALRARGVNSQGGLNYQYDLSGGIGGPVWKDKLWFYNAYRKQEAWLFAPGNFYNLTPNTLFYTPDLNRPAQRGRTVSDISLRLTWQASQKHKITFSHLHDHSCDCGQAFVLARPDGARVSKQKFLLTQVGWVAPVTSRLLFEAKGSYLDDTITVVPQAEGVLPTTISILDLADGYRYGSQWQNLSFDYGRTPGIVYRVKATVSYVTGSHAFKAGLMETTGKQSQSGNPYSDVTYTFNNRVPVSLTQIARPYFWEERVKMNLGVFAQDQWTIKRLTLNLGVRYDYLNAYTPAQTRPATSFTPLIDVPEVPNTPIWKDLSPRLGAAYDLFGDGKTAIKISWGRYVLGHTIDIAQQTNPGTQVVGFAERTWNDTNRDYVPDCDLMNRLANGECGALANQAFGTRVVNQTYDPALLEGWGVRAGSWQTSAAVQHELRPGMALQVGYYRTSYFNFSVTDNLRVTPADYDPYCITAPMDARLPGGGGYQLCGLADIRPAAFGLVQREVTNLKKFGKASEVFDGVDVTVSARFGNGGRLQGGVSTGRTVYDNCYVVDLPQTLQCKQINPWIGQTDFKVNLTYPLPWWGLQAAAVFQNLQGFPIQATYVATNAQIAPSLGRSLGACRGAATCAATVTIGAAADRIGLLEPFTEREDRPTQLDVRLTKNLRLGRTRLQGNFDVYNVFNGNTVGIVNTRYGPAWLQPLVFQDGRLFKFSGVLNF
jgi:hypothetical protein